MQCLGCNYSESRVVKSIRDDMNNIVQRRRECLRCGKRFTTHEKMREDKKLVDDRYPPSREI